MAIFSEIREIFSKKLEKFKKKMSSDDNIIIVKGQSLQIKKPDLCTIQIKIFSRKKEASEASTSVNRRLEYILQVLKINNYKQEDIQYNIKLEDCKTFMEHLNSDNSSDDLSHLLGQQGNNFVALADGTIQNRNSLNSNLSRQNDYICLCSVKATLKSNFPDMDENNNNSSNKAMNAAHHHKSGKSSKLLTCNDILNKSWEAHNILMEKLCNKNSETGFVSISKPELRHDVFSIEKYLQNNGKLAIENAKKKAMLWGWV